MKNFPKLFLTRGRDLRVIICAALTGCAMIACNIPTNNIAGGVDGGAVNSVSVSPSETSVAQGGKIINGSVTLPVYTFDGSNITAYSGNDKDIRMFLSVSGENTFTIPISNSAGVFIRSGV